MGSVDGQRYWAFDPSGPDITTLNGPLELRTRGMGLPAQWKSRRLCVSISPTEATYSLLRGEGLQVKHHGEPLEVPTDIPVTRPVPPAPRHPRPRQPPGREPRPRYGAARSG